MRRSGRFNPFIVVGVVCVILLVPLFIISGQGPEKAAAEFMTALGEGNVEKLSDLGVIGTRSREDEQKLWQESLKNSNHYVFTWQIADVSKIDDTHAAVIVKMHRNLQIRMGEEESRFQLPMVSVDGQWRVAVDQMNREMYPYLPRP